MPYIRKDMRPTYRPAPPVAKLDEPGVLNYQITVLVDNFIRAHGLNYNNINSVMGALEGAKLEFYRRVAVPYENKKIEENGDVYAKPR